MSLLIFDFDGVIVNTFDSAFEIMRDLLNGNLTESEYRDWFNGNVYQKFDPNLVGVFFQRFAPRLLATETVPGMIELIRKLKDDGERMVIVSSTMDEPIKAYLEKFGIAHCFERVYGATTEISKTEKLKMALADTGAEASEAVFITDTLGDIRTAKKIGVSSIAVTWGYHPLEVLKEGEPDAIAESVEVLIDSLQELAVNK